MITLRQPAELHLAIAFPSQQMYKQLVNFLEELTSHLSCKNMLADEVR